METMVAAGHSFMATAVVILVAIMATMVAAVVVAIMVEVENMAVVMVITNNQIKTAKQASGNMEACFV
jgi:hypothetical protein